MPMDSLALPRHPRTLGDAFLATRSMNVLLAEDNIEMRQMLERTLRRDGYRVTAVADGDALLAAIDARFVNRGTPELIISDVRMPGRSGLQVLELLRATDLATPVVLITAFGDAETHSHAERFGATVLDKPFQLDDLRAVARRHVEIR